MVSIRTKSLIVFSLSFLSCYAGDASTTVLNEDFKIFIYKVSNLGSKMLQQVPSELSLDIDLAAMQKLYGENIEAAKVQGRTLRVPDHTFKYACQVLDGCFQESSLPVKVAAGVGLVLIPVSLGYSGYRFFRAIKKRITNRNQKDD
jgi:hypothetical protein